MIKSNDLIWDHIAPRFAAELITSTSEVHYGVGIPGNSTLNLVDRKLGGTALDLGCAAGENLVALSRLGYHVTGIDGSATQLKLAKELLGGHDVKGELIRGDGINTLI